MYIKKKSPTQNVKNRLEGKKIHEITGIYTQKERNKKVTDQYERQRQSFWEGQHL